MHPLERIGRYRVTGKLGEGGMGVVYAAHDDRLGRSVALKMLREAAADQRSRDRLWREARTAAALNHPNICQLYEVGEEAGALFIAMELLEGEPLAARLARGPLPVSEAGAIELAILSSLEALHRRGIVHRDLKPSNVFLTPHGVKLLDFGLAREASPAEPGATVTDITLPGTLVGTPRYLSPEQIRGERVDGRTDLFSAGIVLYEMLTGRPPFDGATVTDVLHAILHDKPPVLGGSPAVTALDRIVHRALRKSAAARYPDAAAMANDLRAALLLSDSGEITTARPVTRLIVLPFRMLRPDPAMEFLAFALADAVTSSLSSLGSLVVRSSVTASRFAAEAPDLEALAAKAEVDAVLTGTLLTAGDQIRMNVQLMEAPGGAVRWSQTSQVPLGDVFQLQDELVRRIVESLTGPLTAQQHGALGRGVPRSPKAYEFYLRANELGLRAQTWTLAKDMYLQAVELDPEFAPAWARLGRIYRVLAMYASGPQQQLLYDRAAEAFDRAFEIDADLSLAHNLYTNLEIELGHAPEATLRLLQRLRRHPADAELYAGLVQACRYCGLLDASIAAYEEVQRLDPGVRTSVAHAYLMTGQYERAIETNLEDPRDLDVVALDLLGRHDEALALAREIATGAAPPLMQAYAATLCPLVLGDVEAAQPMLEPALACFTLRDPCGRYYLARTLARAGDRERALSVLDQAVSGGFHCHSWFARDPWLDSLRTDARFRAILQRAEQGYRRALAMFLEADGPRLLGLQAGGTA